MTDEPQLPNPVRVTNPEPIPVDVKNDELLRVRTEQDKVAASRVTSADRAMAAAKVDSDIARAAAGIDADILRTDDQRRISGIWERTQQVIALSVVEGALFIVGVLVLTPSLIALGHGDVPDFTVTASIAGMLFVTGVANLVIGFYFGRVNHQRVGGDPTPREAAQGR